MNTKANNRIAIAALGAPVLAAIAVGLAAPAWAGSEQVEPSQPAEVGEAGMWSMPREVQEQAAPNINVVLPKPDTNPTLDQCTVIRHDGFDPAQPPASNGVSVEAFC